MAVVVRGWSRTASTAVKLATAERIIGYQFNDVDRLFEALDQKKTFLSPSGRKRPRNTRLALVGDVQAKLYMAQKWYDQPDLHGNNWHEIISEALSNDRLGEYGFKLGLDECASKSCFITNPAFLKGHSQASLSLDRMFLWSRLHCDSPSSAVKAGVLY